MEETKKSGSNPFSIKDYPNCHGGHQYAEDIVAGLITANIYIKGVCAKYLREIETYGLGTKNKYYFVADKAEKYLRLVQKFHHVVGTWKTPTVMYEPWQKFIFMNIMGWYNPITGFRRYRVAHIEVARGSGKSLLASQACLYFLACDDSVGNKISCLATKKEQARIVLDSARAMALKNRSFCLAQGVKVLAHKITQDSTFSEVRALSSDSNGLDGLQDILAVMDELHAMQKAVFEVIISGMSKRQDSLTLCITTAGVDIDSIGYSQSCYAKKVSIGEVIDDQFFPIIYTLDVNDDIFEEANWIKANPNFGISVDPITFRAKANKAKVTPADISNFKIKHLNIWLSEAHAFYDLNKWDECADPTIRIEDFYGRKCFVGQDLSSKIDLTSIVFIFEKDGKYYIFDRSFIPAQTVKESRNALYENCIGLGHLIQTPGEAIQYARIQEEVIKLSRQTRIASAFYDPWNATEHAQRLLNARINMVEFRMNTASLSEPTKMLDALMRQKKIVHNGSPIMRYCIGNIMAKEDAANNVFPRKSHDKLKIDIAIATIMALAGWLQEVRKPESRYAGGGSIRVL